MDALCDVVATVCEPGDCSWQSDPVADVAAAKCLLTAVQAGQPGRVRVEGLEALGEVARNIWIVDPSTVVIYHDGFSDFGFDQWTRRCVPKNDAFFVDCITSDDPMVLGDCVRGFFEACEEQGAVACPVG
jgi:hypothetical protein